MSKVRPRTLFSDFYFQFLHPEIHRTLNGAAKEMGLSVEQLESRETELDAWHLAEIFNREDRLSFVREYIAACHEALPEVLRVPFLLSVEKAIDAFGKKYAAQMPGDIGVRAIEKAFKKLPKK